MVAVLAPWLVLMVLITRAQRDYIRRYREARGLHIPLSEEIRSVREGWAATWTKLRIYQERQSDAELEQARRRVTRLQWLAVAYMIGLFVFFGCSVIAAWFSGAS